MKGLQKLPGLPRSKEKAKIKGEKEKEEKEDKEDKKEKEEVRESK